MGWMKDETGLEKNAANFVPLTPLSHLRRAARLFPDDEALVYKSFRKTYTEYYERCTRLASALTKLGVEPGDVVATLLPNIPAHAEAHFGVPACGAVLNAINTRLESDTVSYIFGHGEAKIALIDSALIPVALEAIEKMDGPGPKIIEVPDPVAGIPASGDHMTYDDLLATGEPTFDWVMPQDEWESLALNYTSGTTGRPKGVVYHHRGAYLMTMGTAVSWPIPRGAKYLTIVPLFHCNNWNHTWAAPMVGGTVICCRDITAKNIYDAIADEGVTHFGAAPIVLNTIVNSKPADRREFDHIVEVFTAGAPPPAATLAAIEPLGFNVTQVYGLTETYGHVTECVWQNRWNDEPDEERYAIKARTGVLMPMMEDITAMEAESMSQIPMDGTTQGEIMIRGNSVMKGYLKNPEATGESFRGGYFHSGDIALQHPDGYLRIADRAKDIIISGGENISSIEVEGVLMKHPAVLLCAVVAKPDEKWGEVPCAFVEVKEDATVTEEDLIAFTRERLAGFKTPKKVIFRELPKTSTGKIQKFELRQALKEGLAE
ncbi:AMP-binding protein [Roseovarius indicus]|uniref:3-methylmercaptopropionyl-CoA ligase n=1 Tax=Roseovarius indicus TaxID=540747 RepID=A0A0T5P5M3_9RHOB|nr:AMP-binding protein [Roseovarius indicus]KRS16475.1 acyl-CoA synthetase [Roseovarius indicus]QEW28112.1 Long-chain-fatty-acid--CoA ligase [Roseovarius indicus]SFE54307.1 fatty-acyl-CoA synthase [Roseovarius indicus]